ncbi:DUF4286 family protein [Phyllobacterium sp. P30BS-XVII]|uniref:DUF4286 family protein n=1 Tax=Phyllobacterium sp. P30BS-XVII TaxID=2587046 RepID=UPI0015F81366|nr:DUF4286 family protein [Phyllobacterium sp. P30BS-XVII]MBA8902996.1 hypothetical protein [Phyllobacterium sp. P30BS-XVII]
MTGPNTATQEEAVPAPSGMLFVWSDVDPSAEDDYNRWYDREHVEERVRIPGFSSGTRYQIIGAGRRYLGLYRTTSLDVFASPAYEKAFTRQTPWSVTNLGRMIDPMRRVCSVTAETGFGTGAYLAVLRLDRLPNEKEMAAFRGAGALVQELPGVISTSLLIPDTIKSTPLPNEVRDGRVLDPILLIEASSEKVAREAAFKASNFISPDASLHTAFLELLWQLQASHLSSHVSDTQTVAA